MNVATTSAGTAQPHCRLCASARTHDLGAIPDSDYFAGRVLGRNLAGGHLWVCGECASLFRHPILSAGEYVALYRPGEPEQWSDKHRAEHWDGSRKDLRIIGSILLAGGARNVLDIGCGPGEFLDSLPAGVARFGIEPSAAAAELARRRGVEIVGSEIEDCDARRMFDAVTIIDVIEHVPEPDALLSRAYEHLNPDGLLVVSTGDPDNKLWRRFLRGRFWYVSFPEHITFPSAAFFSYWCRRVGATLAERHVIPYQRVGLPRQILGVAIQLGYAVSPGAFNWLGRSLSGSPRPGALPRRTFAPGVPGTFRDHHILVVKKTDRRGRADRPSA